MFLTMKGAYKEKCVLVSLAVFTALLGEVSGEENLVSR